jgi:hypothetical protein
MEKVKLIGIGIAIICAMVTGGCGGGQSSASTTAQKDPYPKGPTRQFYIPGGENGIQIYGHEGTPAERRQASAVLEGWTRARAAKRWAKDCSYLSQTYKTSLVKKDAYVVTNGQVKTCPAALHYFGSEASGTVGYNMAGPVASLRVGEGRAYAQYHGRGGTDWYVPMERDGNEWKVAVSAPLPR